MTLSPWLPLFLALPVLWLGERLVARVRLLNRFNIPAPVVGGLLIAIVVLGLNLAGRFGVRFATQVSAPWWTWLVTIEPEWVHAPAKSVTIPLLVAFFVCVGLNSTWAVVRKGSVQVVFFLAVATLLAVLQNFAGVAVARLLGLHPYMGVLCGSLTMTGGHATTLGFASMLEAGGLKDAVVIGSTMATMGLVLGSLIGGPIAGWLIRRHRLKSDFPMESAAKMESAAGGIFHDLRTLARQRTTVLIHLLLVLVVVKCGAWASHFLIATGATFPVHIGAMLLGTAVRNLIDVAAPGAVRSEVITPIGAVFLAWFLAMAMMSLNLAELVNVALPLLIMLAVQVVVMTLFAVAITFRVMGRDYEAAQMAAGHCGFGIGNTANAVATMQTLVEKYGPAPRAFLVVPLVGGMLGDLTNAVNVTLFLKWLK